MIQVCKNPIVKQFKMDFCIVIMRVLNNYDKKEMDVQKVISAAVSFLLLQ